MVPFLYPAPDDEGAHAAHRWAGIARHGALGCFARAVRLRRSRFLGSWWCVPFFFAYGVLYGSSSDSRWHESGHGTAFKSRWLNDVIYQIASFMIMREPTIWRWSHARHHTDTI